MAIVVLCSELGRVPRELARLADCALELQGQDHTVRLVCQGLTTACSMDEFATVSIFPAPKIKVDLATRRALVSERPKNYSSVLYRNGFHSTDALFPALRSWLHILATLDADLIIADNSPMALLAAKLLQISSVMIGTGYTVPPVEHPLPCVAPWLVSKEGGDTMRDQLIKEDQKLLAVVNETIKKLNFGDVELSEAHEVFSHADQWLATFPEMDHYSRGGDNTYVIQPVTQHESQTPEWPSVAGDKVFVYMNAKSSHLPFLLRQLKGIGDPVLAVIPNVNSAVINEFSAPNITIQRDKVDICQVVEQCKVSINHCGHNFVYELLSMGVPSIFLPNSPQNTLMAYRLAKKRVGFAGPAKARKLDIAKLLEAIKKHDQVWANASRVSLRRQDDKSMRRLAYLIAKKFPGDADEETRIIEDSFFLEEHELERIERLKLERARNI